jgi:serine/threonine-protein kinase HipA
VIAGSVRSHGTGPWLSGNATELWHQVIGPALSRRDDAALPDQDINEHLTMRTASLVGLRVPATSVVDFAGQRALVVEHCDRARIGDGLYRVHQEGVCQALGVSPARRHEADGGTGPADIAGLLRWVVAGPEYAGDVLLFLEALGFNWFVGGADAYAKNYPCCSC